MSQDTQAVDLPAALVARVEDRLPYTEFDSSAEYVAYLTEEVLYHVEEETDDEEFEPVDEDEVRTRLRALGYLNE